MKKIFVAGAAGTLLLGGIAAANRADFQLGQNVEMVVGMMRAIFLHYVDPVDADRLGKGAAAGMVSALDPYTELIHSDDSESFEMMTTGKYGGIGAVIRQRGEWVQVAEPYEGSPADRAGLEIGDTFLRIKDLDARGMTTSQVSAALKGDPGTEIEVSVKKFYSGETQTIKIRREIISVPAVPYFGIAADSVGYIRHTEFTDGSADEVRSALERLKSLGTKSLVLDLRSNGGGILQEAVDILGMFVPRGTEVVSMRGRNVESTKTYRTENEPIELAMPIAVMVDGYSASAAEIVAGALQDLDRGVVIGQRTYGKGLVQSTLPIGFGSYLKITTAKYYIPSGRCIQAVDYSQPTEDEDFERKERVIPDSLIGEFRTAGGRRVYDGGGVMPDIRLEPEYSSRFAYVLYSGGYIDDWADQWSKSNREKPVDAATFALSAKDWADFTKFIAAKEVKYESATGRALENLRKTADHERYATDEFIAAIDKLNGAIKDDSAGNMELHRTEISRLIEDAIVLRRHYSRGVTQHKLHSDSELQKAIETLHNPAQYKEITTTRDTQRK